MEEKLKEQIFISSFESLKPNLKLVGQAFDHKLSELMDSLGGFNKDINLEIPPNFVLNLMILF